MPDTALPPYIRIRPMGGWRALRLWELWEFRDVAWMLALRDAQVRYKQTALGVVWVVMQPLLASLVFAFVFGRFAGLPSDGVPYGLFIFAGLVGWQIIAGIIQRAGPSLVAETRLVTKVYFPRILVPLASAGAVLVDLSVSTAVFLLYAWTRRAAPGLSLFWFPFWILVAFALAAGVGIWFAALNVRYRDFMHATPFLLQLWLFASPIVYSKDLIPEPWRIWFALNPVVGILDGIRGALLGHSLEFGWPGVIAITMSCAVLVSGFVYFRRVEQSFADQL
jgi:lipopolysaccharide transport system permease protein